MVLDILTGTEFSWGHVCSFYQILKELHDCNKLQKDRKDGNQLPQRGCQSDKGATGGKGGGQCPVPGARCPAAPGRSADPPAAARRGLGSGFAAAEAVRWPRLGSPPPGPPPRGPLHVAAHVALRPAAALARAESAAPAGAGRAAAFRSPGGRRPRGPGPGAGHAKMQAEIGMKLRHAKECQRLPISYGS
ncbi:translation initiation factor IF-2-like [Vulpes lagopus]|uniref:translation initiation factor IF-2-like n=1 Tax=Vulpes lagopus TaxID=494514 RepID=UPI001BC91102|nr:translation initiation factor IF-2-like [Vulpes lagopus]